MLASRGTAPAGALPFLGALAVAALLGTVLCARLGAPLSRRSPVARALIYSLAILAVYCSQELLEGALAAGHPPGLMPSRRRPAGSPCRWRSRSAPPPPGRGGAGARRGRAGSALAGPPSPPASQESRMPAGAATRRLALAPRVRIGAAHPSIGTGPLIRPVAAPPAREPAVPKEASNAVNGRKSRASGRRWRPPPSDSSSCSAAGMTMMAAPRPRPRRQLTGTTTAPPEPEFDVVR
jgi:hypothetical protein